MIHPRALLVAGCALFGAVILIELYSGTTDDASLVAVQVPAIDTPAAVQTRPARPEELLSTSRARPLFSPTRRPQNEGASAPKLTDKRLSGIIIDEDHRLAVFAVDGANPLVVNEGETVDGWQIVTITPDEISLTSPSGTQSLQPALDKKLVHQPRVPPRRGAAATDKPSATGSASTGSRPPRSAARDRGE
jgi:hypothetical protein